MSRKYTISVIIPTYNRAGKVGHAIESALQQSSSPFEVIVSNDGSTDETVAVVNRFGSSVKLISRPHRGKASTLNHAIRQASGDWIAVLDDDDTWTKEKLELQTKALGKHPDCRLCFSNSAYLNNPAGPPHSFAKVRYQHAALIGALTDSTRYVLQPPHGIFIQSCLINKELLVNTGGFDEQLSAADDTDMIFRLSLLTPFCYVNRPLTQIDRTPIRSHGLTDSRRTCPEIYLRDQEIMYGKWLNMVKSSDTWEKSIIRKRHAEVHNAWANLYVSRAEYPSAITHFRRAHGIDPRPVFRVKAVLARYAPALLRA